MTKKAVIKTKNNCINISKSTDLELHQFIINELSYHFKFMAGLGVKITDNQAGINFKISKEIEPDSFICQEKNGTLFIQAGTQRGLYYGVMAFFEELGCRHFAPGEENSVIPRLKCICLPHNWHIEGKPSLPWRGYHICGSGLDSEGKMIWHYDHATALFMIRNRLNFKPIHNNEDDKITPLLDSMLISSLAFGHSYSEWISSSEFAIHPEFFPLIGGERVPKGQLCLSNKNLQDLIAERIVKYLLSHPKLKTISLAPNDGYGFCECENCLALDSEFDRSTNSTNRRNHYFAARIAEKVKKTCPDCIISTISYCNYKDPGEDIPYQPNLAISICVEVENLIENQLEPPVSPQNIQINDRLKRWQAKAGSIFWSEYLLSYGGNLPRPYSEQLADTIKYLASQGISGFKTEVVAGRSQAWQSAVFFMYAVSRLLYDASLDIDLLLRDFCEKFYGQGAAGALEYYQLTNQIINQRKRDSSKIKFNLISELYSDEDIIELEKSLEKALSVTTIEPYHSRLIVLQKQLVQITCSRQSLVEAATEDVPLKVTKSENAGSWSFMESLRLIQLRQHIDCSKYEQENSFALAHDKNKIYLYFKLGEPDMPALQQFNQTQSLEELPEVCTLSNIDCFLSPSPETGIYYQIMINAKGEYYSARCHDKTWDNGYDLTPEIHRRFFHDRWELLVGIDFERLETEVPTHGNEWRASFNRHYGRYTDGLLGGWPSGGVWHDIENSGIIYFP